MNAQDDFRLPADPVRISPDQGLIEIQGQTGLG
jgi:hypothetical protein